MSYTITAESYTQHTVVFKPWPNMSQLMRVTHRLRRCRRGYYSLPLLIDGSEYRRRQRRRRRR